MGVFARLLRRSKTTEEASAEEARTGTPDTEHAAEETAQAVETADSGPRDTSESAEADEAAGATDAEGVGIPKQQSAGEAVDNEADNGART
ncbi:hypothetical protein [Streptomyces sp. M92]|uniref:hypothetical protein n=1 Tax=Streptomyces sp. M92 TaxID=2944250 RepID=UPI002349DA5D|nr:hypothetical protein [Streptomyces sp. M92]WCN03647.1 hypothetical protein M6G08_16910 [Streptomyces sp. M92]